MKPCDGIELILKSIDFSLRLRYDAKKEAIIPISRKPFDVKIKTNLDTKKETKK